MAEVLSVFDKSVIIQAGVNGLARATGGLASVLRRAQTGRVENYALFFTLGVLICMIFFLR